jgi:hypothetical protein
MWDPYASIMFTRSDLASKERTQYIIDLLANHPERIAYIDGPEVMDNEGFVDVEIPCLFETNGEVLQKIFDADSKSLKLALLLNPSISNELRSQIVADGVTLEFLENFEGLPELIEQAETYKDPGLALILQGLDVN